MVYAGAELSELEQRCLRLFPEWLNTLPEDALALLDSAIAEEAPLELRAELLGALNYLFKSLDLIPDGIEELGYLDDAFVFRALVSSALQQFDSGDTLVRYKDDAALVTEFLGDDYERLVRYVGTLREMTVRGRTAAQLLAEPDTLAQFADEVRNWAESYAPPTFAQDGKNLVRLRSFLLTKLPQ